MTDTFNDTGICDNDFRQSPEQTKNLLTRFSKVDKVLPPGYDRVVRTNSQTYPFIVGLKTVDQLPLPVVSEETLGVSWVCNIQ